MPFEPQSVTWSGTRALVLVHGVGDYKKGDYDRLLTSLEQAFVALRTGRPTELPPPIDAEARQAFDPALSDMLAQLLRYAVVGGPETVRQGVTEFVAATGVDELMTTAMIFDHAARLRSFESLAQVFGLVHGD